ncbi:MAG: cytochrome c3 family protein [Firmicutes bacterium]|nr:cytochrome c3 family protein [Bacillota bacterium]
MKRFATLTILLLLTMLLLAGTASANTVVSGVYGATGWRPDITGGWSNSNRSGETGASVYGEVYLGFAPLIRNVPGQLTHTAFQLNTNSCASCHMTHTAVGANLLIRNTTTNTCFACHDGTMGFLNVNAPATGTAIGAGMGGSVAAGTFGVNSTRTPSMHNVLGGVTISGAPGGNRMNTDEQAGASWSEDFTCTSCHAPHGSHSIRLLHGNPNNVALRAMGSVTSGVYTAGGRFSPNARAAAFTVAAATYDSANLVWRYPAASVASLVNTTIYGPWVAGYGEGHSITNVARITSSWTRIYHSAWDPNTVAGGIYADPTSDEWGPLPNNATNNLNNMLTRFFTINFATGELLQTDAQRTALITRLQAAPFNLRR